MGLGATSFITIVLIELLFLRRNVLDRRSPRPHKRPMILQSDEDLLVFGNTISAFIIKRNEFWQTWITTALPVELALPDKCSPGTLTVAPWEG